MVQETTTRHLHAVPDESEVPTGLVWHDEPSDHEPETQHSGTTPVSGRVMPASEADTSLTPAQADRAQITDRLRASLEAANTYALLAWHRKWDVAMSHVMDPSLRQDMIDEAEAALDAKIASTEKKLRRAINPEDTTKLSKQLDRLNRREISTLEIDARVVRTRTTRLAGKCVLPASVIVGPVLLAMSGTWIGLLAWPAAWGWLAVQGRAMARADVKTTATDTATSRIEARARELTAPTTVAATTAAVAATVVGASDDENQILSRLSNWEELATARGLDGTTPGDPVLAETGLSVVVTCAGRITPEALIKKTNAVRSLLGVPTGIALDIVQGERGDQALVRIRTRTPQRDMEWQPGKEDVGVDVTTGEVVDLEVYHRMLIAGASRSGKTVMMRVLMAKVVADPNACLILIDAKRVEAARWRHVARTACTPDEISGLAAELKWEMTRRYEEISETGRAWVPSPEKKRMVIVVDEGAELIAMDHKELGILENLRSLAMMGGEAEMHLWWCTQKPTKTGDGRGIDSAIAGQMTGALVCLRTTSPTEARTVLGEDANAAGWNSHLLERAGLALIRDGERGPDPVAVWNLSDEEKVLALPPQTRWGLPDAEVHEPVTEPEETEAEEAEEDEGQGDGNWIGAQHAVMQALHTGPKTTAQLQEITGYSKSMIHNALGQHEAAGKVVKGPGHRAAWRAL
ncbi:FtsK/SpoIIIE domain-containing protein [Nocardiopsis alba]|uniref:FtsK/SpoIIIE domain-containing protein n=1 Tax=Nocardiopsis alba TaxID=53437 RepID=UPI00366BFAF4